MRSGGELDKRLGNVKQTERERRRVMTDSAEDASAALTNPNSHSSNGESKVTNKVCTNDPKSARTRDLKSSLNEERSASHPLWSKRFLDAPFKSR